MPGVTECILNCAWSRCMILFAEPQLKMRRVCLLPKTTTLQSPTEPCHTVSGVHVPGRRDMRGWVRSTLMPRLPRSLLTWSGVWATVIKPVLHHNIMLRNRVSAPFTQGPAAMLLQQPVRNVACCLMHLLFIDMLQLLSLMHLT